MTWDKNTDKRIMELHPKLRFDVEKVIYELADKKIFVRITESFRTAERQHSLFMVGRKLDKKTNRIVRIGKVLTNADSWESFHQYALAFDVVPIVNGIAIWNNDLLWKQIAKAFKDSGFEWAGDWKSFVEMPHFQKVYGLSLVDLRNRVKSGKVDKNGFVVV